MICTNYDFHVEQVKLAELLGRAGPRVRPSTPGKYEDAPDSYRASVCCLVRMHTCELCCNALAWASDS